MRRSCSGIINVRAEQGGSAAVSRLMLMCSENILNFNSFFKMTGSNVLECFNAEGQTAFSSNFRAVNWLMLASLATLALLAVITVHSFFQVFFFSQHLEHPEAGDNL